MSEERGYTGGEIASFVTFGVLATLIGVGAYQIGYHNLSRAQHGGASMTAVTENVPVNGQTLYAGNCAGCHGAKAEGGVGPALATSAGWSLPDFSEAVLNGNAPAGRQLSPVMPHFAQQGLDGAPATEEQVKAIHDYLGTVK